VSADKQHVIRKLKLSCGQDISADADAVLEGEGLEQICQYRSVVGAILGPGVRVTAGEGPAAVVCHWGESGVQQTLADADKVFPGARDQFEVVRLKCWSEDTWQRGGLTRFDPGELNWIPVNARREGRILFAGEHTSRWNGWMQGAIESGHRVVKEISA
jgi:Flavin containing amine oxidoreductase